MPFPDHVAGHLVLETVHAFVEVHGRPAAGGVVDLRAVPLGKGDHQQAGLAGHRVPAARLVGLAIRADVGREVVGPERLEGPLDVMLASRIRPSPTWNAQCWPKTWSISQPSYEPTAFACAGSARWMK